MPEFVTLQQFDAAARHYHIYRIQSSALDHQAHYHNYYQVCFVVSGQILHCQGGDVVTLGAGDAFIVPPGFIHSLHFDGTRSQIYSLSFDELLFHPGFPQSGAYHFLRGLQEDSPVLPKQSVHLRVLLDKEQRRLLQNLMDGLIYQQRTESPSELSAAPSLIAAILCILAQGYYQQPQNATQLSEQTGYSSILTRCMEYIDVHYRQTLTLEGLAKEFGMSRSSFCTLFPQFAGMTLRKYIAHKRIMEAQMLIRSRPELTLSQISLEVGYEDDSTFYRNFLQISGVSPSRYRELYQDAQ